MNEDSGIAGDPHGGEPEPGEEEFRRALEEQMRNTRVEELLVQSVVSLINLSARRVAIEEERDLGQAKLGIDAVRALLDLLPPEIADQVRQALSQLQLEYAQVSGGGSNDGQAGGVGAEPGSGGSPLTTQGGGSQAQAGGPETARSKLWTPPGTA